MRKLKLLIPIVATTILFIVSFILQSKYNSIILENVNGGNVEGIVSKQFMVLGGSFAFINLLITSIVVCFAVIFVILVFVLINRRRMEKRAKIKAELTEVYQGMILDGVEGNITSDADFENYKNICNSRFKKAVLIDQIIDVALMLPKDMLGNLREFYMSLGLLKETERKLYSRKWHKKIKAIKELSHLEIKFYNSTILKYVNDKNDTLRMEAQIAMVRLSDDENPLMFLEHLDHEFSTWEQITLHELMEESNIVIPDFSKWLVSDNHDVGMFCLRMVREYRQKNVQMLRNMLYHPNSKVGRFAIEVVGDLELQELSGELKKIYKDEPYLNSLEVVKSLGKIGDPKTIQFLQHVVDSEDDTQLQIEGVKAINSCGEEGRVSLEKMLKSDYKDYKIIVKHVLDNRIN